jgi:hypothetical protein
MEREMITNEFISKATSLSLSVIAALVLASSRIGPQSFWFFGKIPDKRE